MGTRCTLGAMKEMLVLETSAETTELVQTEAMMIDTIGRAIQLQLTIQIHHAFFVAFYYDLLQTSNLQLVSVSAESVKCISYVS